MRAKEESEQMLRAEDHRGVAILEYPPDDRSPALGSPPTEPATNNHKGKSDKPSTLLALYNKAQGANTFRYICVLVVLGSAAWIVSKGTALKTTWIVLPWAAYSLGCAILHAILTNPITFRAHPRSTTSASPPHAYLAIATASALSLLAAFGVGLAVLVLTHDFYNQRDTTRTESCGRRHRRKCHPFTAEAAVYNISIVCFVFTVVALPFALIQWHSVWLRIRRIHWTEEDILAAWTHKDVQTGRDRAKRFWRWLVGTAA